MTLDYFYCPPESIKDSFLVIEGDEFTHLTHVMRKREGEFIRVVDGKGMAYDAQISSIKKKEATCTVTATYPQFNESPKKIVLCVGLLKNPSRFDFLIEKATELGVYEIIPLISSRTIPSHSKVERWQKLALAAMKQSCRSYLPIVREASKLEKVIQEFNLFEEKLIFHEKAEKQLSLGQKNIERTIILIGPEGGFSEEEVEFCIQNGYSSYLLGERRLRTETAAIAAVSLVMLGG